MKLLLFYPCLLATLLSVVLLTRIAYIHHDKTQPRNLSELAAKEDQLLIYFRNVLWTCGTLFAITVYGLLVPRTVLAIPLCIAWTITYLGNLLLAIVPARNHTVRLHNFFAQTMGAGMLGMACIFWLSFTGIYATFEIALAILMTILGAMAFIDKKRFIVYELSFLFASHITIVVAAIGLIIFDNNASWCTGGQPPMGDVTHIANSPKIKKLYLDYATAMPKEITESLIAMTQFEGVSVLHLTVPLGSLFRDED